MIKISSYMRVACHEKIHIRDDRVTGLVAYDDLFYLHVMGSDGLLWVERKVNFHRVIPSDFPVKGSINLVQWPLKPFVHPSLIIVNIHLKVALLIVEALLLIQRCHIVPSSDLISHPIVHFILPIHLQGVTVLGHVEHPVDEHSWQWSSLYKLYLVDFGPDVYFQVVGIYSIFNCVHQFPFHPLFFSVHYFVFFSYHLLLPIVSAQHAHIQLK